MDEADKPTQKFDGSSNVDSVNGGASFTENESDLSNSEKKAKGSFGNEGDMISVNENDVFFSDDDSHSNKDLRMSSGEEGNKDREDETDVVVEGAEASLDENKRKSPKRLPGRRSLTVEYSNGYSLSGLAQTIKVALKYGKLSKVRTHYHTFKKYFIEFVDAESSLKMVEDIAFLLKEHDLQVSYFVGRITNGIMEAKDSDIAYCFTEYLDFHDLFIEEKYKSKSGIFCENFIDLHLLWKAYWDVKSSFSHATPADFLDGLLLIDLPPTRKICEHIATFLKLRCYEKLCPRLQSTDFSSNLVEFVNQLNAGVIKTESRIVKNKPGDAPGKIGNGLGGGSSIEIRGSKVLLVPQLLSVALRYGNVVKMKKIPDGDKLIVRVLFDEDDSNRKMLLAFEHDSLKDEKAQLQIAVAKLGSSAVNCNPQLNPDSFDNVTVFNNIYLASEYVSFWNEIHKMGVKKWNRNATDVMQEYFMRYIQLKFFFLKITCSQFLKDLSLTKEAFTKGTEEPLRLQFQLYESIALNQLEEGTQNLNNEAIESLNDPHYTFESLKHIMFVPHVPTVRANCGGVRAKRGGVETYASLIGKLRKVDLSTKNRTQKKRGHNSENAAAKTGHKKMPKFEKKNVQTGTSRGSSQYEFRDSRGPQFQYGGVIDAQPNFQRFFDFNDGGNVFGRLGPRAVPEMNRQFGAWGLEDGYPVNPNYGLTGPRDMHNYVDSLSSSIERYFVGPNVGSNRCALSSARRRNF